MVLILVLAILIGSLASACLAQAPGDAAPSGADARVQQLLTRLTLDEKIRLIHDGPEDPSDYQGQAGYVAGVPRLGVPGLRLADGPPGVLTRHPSQAEVATMGVAATFDERIPRGGDYRCSAR